MNIVKGIENPLPGIIQIRRPESVPGAPGFATSPLWACNNPCCLGSQGGVLELVDGLRNVNKCSYGRIIKSMEFGKSQVLVAIFRELPRQQTGRLGAQGLSAGACAVDFTERQISLQRSLRGVSAGKAEERFDQMLGSGQMRSAFFAHSRASLESLTLVKDLIPDAKFPGTWGWPSGSRGIRVTRSSNPGSGRKTDFAGRVEYHVLAMPDKTAPCGGAR